MRAPGSAARPARPLHLWGAPLAPSDSLELVGEAVVVRADPGACRFLPETHQILQPLGEAQKLFRLAGCQQGRWGWGPGEGVRRPEPRPRATASSPPSCRLCGPIRKMPRPSVYPSGALRGVCRSAAPRTPMRRLNVLLSPHTRPPTPRPAELSAAFKASASRCRPRPSPGRA